MASGFPILHGVENHRPPEHCQFLPAAQLVEHGLEVRYPALPEPDAPELERWLATFEAGARRARFPRHDRRGCRTQHARHRRRTVTVRVVPPHSAADMTMPCWVLVDLRGTSLDPRPVASALRAADGDAVVLASLHDAVVRGMVGELKQ